MYPFLHTDKRIERIRMSEKKKKEIRHEITTIHLSMKIIYNKIIPFGKQFYAINLFGVLFAKGPCNKITINHESIHTAQIKELGYIFFYIIYLMEWLVRIIQYRGYVRGYENISFEREAYSNQYNLQYLKKRKRYSFVKYLKKRQ